MVRELDLFRNHCEAFADRYALIGGTACDLILKEVGLGFRATKDLDIVLCIESVDADFARAFWAFVKAGRYEVQETAEGRPRFYRFQKPGDVRYPAMLELFSPVPESLSPAEGSGLTPIPLDGEISSLSAILLESDYYDWILSGRREVEGLPVVGAEHLIPLKAGAWLDLSARRKSGENVDSRAVKKHRNDVFRLFQVIDPAARLEPAERVAEDMRSFLRGLPKETVDLESLGLGSLSLDAVLWGLRSLYGLDTGHPA